MTRLVHDVRVQCGRCGTWYWADDAHACSVPGPTNADVLDAAFPQHDRMIPVAADAFARQAGREYRARIAAEDARRRTWYARTFEHLRAAGYTFTEIARAAKHVGKGGL